MAEYKSPGVYVEELPSQVQPIPGAGTSTAGFIGLVADDVPMAVRAGETLKVAEKLKPQLVTNWQEFKKNFGDGIQKQNKVLASAVSGFFDNGGTRCWVIRVTNLQADKDKPQTGPTDKDKPQTGPTDKDKPQTGSTDKDKPQTGSTDKDKPQTDEVEQALSLFEAIDEIAIVAVPIPTNLGVPTQSDDLKTRRNAIRKLVLEHCEKMKNRFAILDGEEEVSNSQFDVTSIYPNNNRSSYGAVYFPHIDIGKAGSSDYIPPSGHIAGIYARVDSDRGMYKAPANEVIHGVQGVKYRLSRAQQDGLNPQGINVIRQFNGTIKVWGARTLSDESKPEYKYINVRRTMLFLRKSIDEGTQWAVFEPNTPALWQKIKRNVSDFLTVQWRSGALFGNTVREAFYVQCDAETNPPEERNLGRVNAVVGVSLVRPAEFIIFAISQTTIPA